MGQNSDINNIFNSYRNNVVLNEAVKPTEEGGAFDPAKAAQKRQELLRQRGSEVKTQANQQPPSPPAPNTSGATSKPSPIVGRANPSTSQGQAAIATNQQQIQQNAQATQQARANQNATSAASLQNLQSGGRTPPSAPQPAQASTPQPAQNQTSQQDAASFFDNMAAQAGLGSSASQSAPLPAGSSSTQSSNNDGEEVETTTQVVPNAVQTQPLVTSDDGSSYTVDQIRQMIDALKMEPLAASDSEMSNDQNDEEENEDDTSKKKSISTVAEKRNIAKFLKYLAEKNYSVANKYLTNIIENKVKRKISGEIK
jgi:hypothetical protein